MILLFIIILFSALFLEGILVSFIDLFISLLRIWGIFGRGNSLFNFILIAGMYLLLILLMVKLVFSSSLWFFNIIFKSPLEERFFPRKNVPSQSLVKVREYYTSKKINQIFLMIWKLYDEFFFP
ncbi:MAG: hypothetical protein HeimC3_35690 [Candidatus Heimdallarchaeota archaeon LC_3]|nr:MAG: hypothetical protein HeimC3_35690 [Candidatus Heimdallarchaeota archaeon LC_3]